MFLGCPSIHMYLRTCVCPSMLNFSFIHALTDGIVDMGIRQESVIRTCPLCKAKQGTRAMKERGAFGQFLVQVWADKSPCSENRSSGMAPAITKIPGSVLPLAYCQVLHHWLGGHCSFYSVMPWSVLCSSSCTSIDSVNKKKILHCIDLPIASKSPSNVF